MRATSEGGTGTASPITRTVDATGPTDGTVTAAAAGSNQINLSWTVATDSGSGLAASNTYKVVRAAGAAPPADCSGTAIYAGTATSYNDSTGLAGNTLYSYRVCAYDAVNNVSAGATQSATTLASPWPTQLQPWTQQYAATAYPNGQVNANYTIADGSNRLLIVAIAATDTAAGSQTVNVSYGGQALTLAAGDGGSTATWNHTYLYYLDEAGIQAASGTNLNVTVADGSGYYTWVYAAVYAGVDQTTHFTDARNFNSAAANNTIGPFNPTLTIANNDQAIQIVNLARSSSGTSFRTITGWASGWTTAGVQPASIATSGPTATMYIRDRIVTTTASDGSQHTANSTSTWDSMTAMSLKGAGTKQNQTISFNTLAAKAYGDADFAPGATASSGLPVAYASSNPSVATIVAGNIHIVGAGTTNITASQAGNATYNAAADVVQVLTVNKAPLTVTAGSASKTYGSVNPPLTVSYSGFVNGDTAANLTIQPTAATTAVTGSPAGSYLIIASGGASANYSFTYQSGTLTVNPAPLTASADNKTKIQGSVNPPLTVSYTGFVNGDTPASLAMEPIATTTATTDSPVGSYPITVSGGVSGNYSFTYVVGTLTVTKQIQTITFNPLVARTYGDTDFAPGATASSGLSVSYASSNPAVATIVAGQIHIVGAGTTNITASQAGDATYEAAADVVQQLTVNKAGQSITFPSPTIGKTYGAADFSTIAATASPLAVTYDTGDPAVATVNATTGLVHIVGAGTVTITANLAGDANYNPASAQTVLIVDKAILTVTPENASRPYGTDNPAFTPVYSGFVNGETPSVLSGSPGFSTTATISSPVGSYPITAAVGTLAAANYSFSFGTATLAVDIAGQTITFNPLAVKTYGDAPFDLTATGGASGNPLTYASSDPAVATISGTTVTIVGTGSAIITVNQEGDGNYASATAQQTLTVDKAILAVTPQDANRPYGTDNPVFTYLYSGFVNGETSTVLTGAPELATTATVASPAGSYPITAAAGTLAAANYTFSFGIGTLAIDLAGQTIAFEPIAPKTFGDASFVLSATGGASGNPVTFTSSNLAVATINGATVTIVGAGSATITASQAGDANYASATAQQTLAVTKALLVVTADDKDRTYGAVNPTLTASFSGFVNGDTAAMLSGAPNLATAATVASPVGSYPVTVAAGNLFSNNYSFTYAAGTLTVNPAPLTVTADNKTKLQGAVNPPLTINYSGFMNGDSEGSLSAVPIASTAASTDSPAGTYPITVSGGASTNYALIYIAGTLTITRQTQTITFNALPVKTYGDADFSPGATATSGLIVSYASSNPAVATIVAGQIRIVGAGTTNITASQSGDANYDPATEVVQPLTVNRAVLTVTADNKSKVYGEVNPPLTFTYSGFVNGETVTNLATLPVAATSASTASPAGTYPITVSGGASANYTFTYVAGALTITKQTQAITFSPLSARTYGDADFSPGATVSSGLSLSYTSSNPAVATIVAGQIHIVGAGTATITASQSGDTNYEAAADVVQMLTVNKAPLAIAADNKTKVQGAVNPSLTVSYTGFVNGDTAASLATQPVATTTAVTDSPVGTYPITVSGGESANYTFTYVPGTLTVSVNVQIITFSPLPAKTYGNADFSPGATASSGLPVSYTSSNPAVATIVAGQIHIVGAGTTNITASQSGDANYGPAPDVVQPFTVTKAVLTVTADNKSKVYGAVNPPLTLSYTGFVNGETAGSLTAQPVVSTAAVNGSPAGSYLITASGGVSGNYAFNYVSGTLTVTPAVLTVTAGNASKTYGSANPALTLSYIGFVNGDTEASLTSQPTAGTTATAGSPAGTYTITAGGGVSGNYSFNYVYGTLTVDPAPLTVTADNKSRSFGAANPSLTVSYTGLVNGDTPESLTTQPSASTTATIDSPVGTYPITVSGGASANYIFTYIPGTLTVSTNIQTITFNPLPAMTYGNADFSPGATASSGLPVSYTSSNPLVATIVAGQVHIVGAGTTNITASQSGDANFGPASDVVQPLTVNKAVLTVTADNKSKSYGTANPVLTVSYSGFVYGDTAASLTAQPTAGTTAVTSSPVGTYPITVSGGVSNNYNFNYVAGTLTIIKQSQTITFNALPNKTYGDADFSPGATASSGLPVSYASSNPAVATIIAGQVHIVGAGTTNITAIQGGDTNYLAAADVVQSLAVDKANLTVTADNQSKTLGAVNPPLTVSYSGFVNGDGPASLTTQPTASTTATTDSPAGTYPITVSGGASANYTFNYVAGTLTINLPAIAVTSFTMPESATSLEVMVTSFTANESVVGYLITETATIPSPGDPRWTTAPPEFFTFGGYGTRTAYAWAKDAIGNISASQSAIVTIHDAIQPTVTAFAMPATSSSLTVTVTNFFATDNLEVTGYMITESTTPPASGIAGWSVTVPSSFTFGSFGNKTAYAWAKDAAGNVSASLSATVSIVGSAARLTVSGVASPRTAGTAGSVTVTATDSNGNTATTYRGTVRFASSDPLAVMPAEYTFTAADNGVHTFSSSVTFKIAGTQAITATDIADQTISGTQGGIQVGPAQASSLNAGAMISPVTAGTASSLTVSARDMFGNIATGYTGTVRFTSTDPQAALPANFTFSAGDAGVHTFSSQVVWKTSGIQSLTVTDISASSLTSSVSGITVNPASAATMAISNIESPRPADVPTTVTVTIKDSYGNLASGYRGTVRFTSTDSQAILPANYTFIAGDAGSRTFNFGVTLKTVGTHTVTVTDIASSALTATQLGILVSPTVVSVQAAQVAAGASHTVALGTDGRVWTWGKNDAGQLGIGSIVDSASPLQVVDVSGIVAVAAGYNHTVALRKDGTVWTWGGNEYGQLGDGTKTARQLPVQVAGVSGVTALAAGSYHTVALKSDGTVIAWGRNGYGQLGDGTMVDRPQPVQVQGLAGIAALAAGANHTILLTSQGEVWGIGANASGQLGTGSNANSPVPVQAGGLAGMKTVAAGLLHSLAVGNDGTVWTWGDNASGQLGDGAVSDSNTPMKITALSEIVDVTGGGSHSVALGDDGSLWVWGGNGLGQLGTGNTAGSSTPVRLQDVPLTGTGIISLAAGGRHTVIAMGNGTVWSWGDNTVGQLGDGSTSFKQYFVPVQKFTDFLSIDAGANHAVALKTDGTVWTWGKNTFGQLGNGTLDNSSLPTQVAGLTGVIAVAAGSSHTAALKNDGTVWSWGLNESGQLGDGTVLGRVTPVQVLGLADVSAIAAGDYFTLALKENGTVWGWGSNTSGQLGDNSTTNRIVPVQVSGLSSVSALAAGYLHALALKSDGTVWAWGNNTFGQLGDATNVSKKVPVQVDVYNVIAIEAGYKHSLALLSGGALWAWGSNEYGQLGDGTNANSNVPVQVTGIQAVSAIAAGSNHSMAVMWDRSVWLWGGNQSGQLGSGTTSIGENTPRQLLDYFDIRTIAAGGDTSFVVKNDASLWAAGKNDAGQLGNGTPYAPAVLPGVLLGNDDISPFTSASLAEGTYDGTQSVTLLSNEPAVIYYTLDGTTPTTASLRYEGPISFSESIALKFFAVDRAGNAETVKARYYTINPNNTLNLYLQGAGSGRIDLSTGGNCTGACSQSFLNGTTVDLTPVPIAGSVFMGWSGCDSVVGQICRVTMSAARNVTANFDPAYTLSLNFIESGTVSFSTGGSCTGTCAKTLRSGTSVEMTASGNDTVFEGWSGCDTASGYSCTVTMNGARSVTAVFGYLVKIASGKDLHIQHAYDASAPNEILMVRAADLTENLTFNRPLSVTLSGGYDSSFSTIIGQTSVQGMLTVTAGEVTVENIVIR